jgi:hypothetical protein
MEYSSRDNGGHQSRILDRLAQASRWYFRGIMDGPKNAT